MILFDLFADGTTGMGVGEVFKGILIEFEESGDDGIKDGGVEQGTAHGHESVEGIDGLRGFDDEAGLALLGEGGGGGFGEGDDGGTTTFGNLSKLDDFGGFTTF